MAEKEARQTGRMLMTIGEACQMLGVSEASLRQWTDEGKVKAFVTPGGHRRYSEGELRSLMKQQTRIHGLKDMAERVEGVVPREREVAQRYMQSSGWYGKLDDGARARLRERGKRLIASLSLFVTRPTMRDQASADCRKIGEEYGEDLAGLGLSLADAIEAFILHRTPVVDAVVGMMANSTPINKQAVAAVPQVNKLIDLTLLALVERHQQLTSVPKASSALEGD